MLVWGMRGIRYTVVRTKWQKSRGGAVLWNRLSYKKLKKCTETSFLAHYCACKFGLNRLRSDGDIREKPL